MLMLRLNLFIIFLIISLLSAPRVSGYKNFISFNRLLPITSNHRDMRSSTSSCPATISMEPPSMPSKFTPTSERIDKETFEKQVSNVRIIALAVVSLVLLNQDSINSFISDVYLKLISNSFYVHYSFEPLWASTCFAVSIASFWVVDKWIPSLHRYRIQKSNSMAAWKNRVQDGLTNEVPWYLGFWIPFGGIVKARRIPSNPPTLCLIFQEVLSALLIYDLLFFLGHNLLHRVPFLYRHVHSKHHKMPTVRAGDSVRHSFMDGMWDVICAVVALNILKAHAFSRLVFNAVAIYLIVEAHAGINFPWMIHNIVPFNIFAGPVAHDLHHQGGSRNFQKFFTYLDSFFGTRLTNPNAYGFA